MKWALIYVLSTSGNWDTGIRYRSFDDCVQSAVTIVEEVGDRSNNVGSGYGGNLVRAWACLPAKE